MKSTSKTSSRNDKRTKAQDKAIVANANISLKDKQELPPGEPEYGTPDEEMPELTPECIAQAVALRDRRLNPPAKKRITIMLDEDIIQFFQHGCTDYKTRINEALLRHMIRVKISSATPSPQMTINRIRMGLDELETMLTRGADK